MNLDELIGALKAEMPKRDGGHGWGAVPRLIGTYTQEEEWPALILGVKNYAQECRRRGKLGTEFVMQAKTFFGRDRHWEEYADMDMRTPAEIALDNQWAHLEARAKALGFKEVDRSRGLATVEYAIKAEEDKRRLRVVV